MSSCSVQFAILFSVVLQVLSQETAGPTCLHCSNVINPAACRTVTECWAGESCFSEELLMANGTRIFNFGCKKNQECSSAKRFVSSGIVIHLCHQCCSTDLCNLDSCFNTKDLACYSCQEKSDPKDCFEIKLCRDDQICYAETAIEEDAQPVHSMGCLDKSTCDLISRTPHRVKRQGQSYLCQKCCPVQGCNTEICPSS